MKKGVGTNSSPLLSASDDLGPWGGARGRAIRADLPQSHCLQKKGKNRNGSMALVQGPGQGGQRIQLPLFQPLEMPADRYRAGRGIFKVNLLFHTQSQVSTFRRPGSAVHHRIRPIG